MSKLRRLMNRLSHGALTSVAAHCVLENGKYPDVSNA